MRLVQLVQIMQIQVVQVVQVVHFVQVVQIVQIQVMQAVRFVQIQAVQVVRWSFGRCRLGTVWRHSTRWRGGGAENARRSSARPSADVAGSLVDRLFAIVAAGDLVSGPPVMPACLVRQYIT